ncbi:MAG: biopolymer transporter ExbD [Caldimicrobium sp.]|nr:biopolymer transporter ExbD [Caldimicrobium sp.]MCX7874291.1 biopolymer transporter ExbD [Caldimicrobium sp.]
MVEREINSMNVIPFVDIMLVLLTIVLVSATFIVVGKIPVNLPQAKGDPSLEPLRIYVSKEGDLYYQNRRLTLYEFEEVLSNLEKDKAVFVGADRRASVEMLMKVISFIRERGIERIALGVQER